MRRNFRKVPTKAPGDFLTPLDALKAIQRQDVLKQLPPPFPLKALRR